MEWGAWGYKRHTSLLPLNSVLVSLARSRNSCGSWTVTTKMLPRFHNILTSRLLLSWLVGNATPRGCTILLKPVWVFKRWTADLGRPTAAGQWPREWLPGASFWSHPPSVLLLQLPRKMLQWSVVDKHRKRHLDPDCCEGLLRQTHVYSSQEREQLCRFKELYPPKCCSHS